MSSTQTSAELLGHDEALRQLDVACGRNRLPHALLFSGPPAIGKRSAAITFVRQLFERADDTARALIAAGTHPDLHLLDRDADHKFLSVEKIRALSAKLQLRPYQAPRSIAIIDNAHEMNLAAANALLMTLEEPTEHSMLILVSHLPQHLPATILSRCQTVYFAPLAKAQAQEIAAKLLQRIGISDEHSTELLAMIEHSLEPWGLDPFVQAARIGALDEKAAVQHLETLADELRSVQRLVNAFLERRRSGVGRGDIALFSSDVLQRKEWNELLWPALIKKLRHAMRHEEHGAIAELADALLAIDRSERMVRERNTNAQLQLTTALLDSLHSGHVVQTRQRTTSTDRRP